MEKQKSLKRRKRRLWWLLVCMAVLVGAAAGTLTVLRSVTDPGTAFTQQVKIPLPQPRKSHSTVKLGNAAQQIVRKQPVEPPAAAPQSKRVNLLVLGTDSSQERVNAGMNFRTDVMMLISLDLAAKTVDILSVPRDSYVRIHGTQRYDKVNAAYTFGGAGEAGCLCAAGTVEDLLGVEVDHYVAVGMNVVKDVVDAMGGVEYDVDRSFTLNGRTLETGLQRLDGQQVLDYCRWRKGGRGDIDRIARQQRILMAVFEQMLSKKQLRNIPRLYAAVKENITTDLDPMQVTALALFAKDLSTQNISRHTLPGSAHLVGGKSYYLIDQKGMSELVQAVFGTDAPYDENLTLSAVYRREG